MGQCNGNLERQPLAMPGDLVRVKDWVEEPHGGWDGAKPGAVGVVRRVEGQVVYVCFRGYTGQWCGYQPELQVLDKMHRPIRRQHSGQWRHGGMKHVCSTSAAPEGPLCTHGDDDVCQRWPSHWSCCGNPVLESLCAGPPSHAPQRELVREGDKVCVKQGVVPTGGWRGAEPGDDGIVRRVTDRLHCAVQFPGQDSLWAAYTPELRVVGGSRKQHAGTWRRSPRVHHCSRPDAHDDGSYDGPLCMHGADDVCDDHWSCCGSTDLTSACSQR